MDEDAYLAYRSAIVSPTLGAIWAKVYAERFWPDLDPPWTQATIDDVQYAVDRLGTGAASRLVDLGCGSLNFVPAEQRGITSISSS